MDPLIFPPRPVGRFLLHFAQPWQFQDLLQHIGLDVLCCYFPGCSNLAQFCHCLFTDPSPAHSQQSCSTTMLTSIITEPDEPSSNEFRLST